MSLNYFLRNFYWILLQELFLKMPRDCKDSPGPDSRYLSSKGGKGQTSFMRRENLELEVGCFLWTALNLGANMLSFILDL